MSAYTVPSVWTEERVAGLLNLVEEGLSSSEIGLRLGVSRNAIIGKLHRLGRTTKILPSRATNFVPDNARCTPRRTGRLRDLGIGPESTEIEPELVENPTSIFDLRPDQCRWPVDGQGFQTLFCGGAVHGRHSYCRVHYRRSLNYQPRLPRAEHELHMRKLAKQHRDGPAVRRSSQ